MKLINWESKDFYIEKLFWINAVLLNFLSFKLSWIKYITVTITTIDKTVFSFDVVLKKQFLLF